MVDALGNPLKCLLTGGEAADISQAEPLIEGFSASHVVADKAYEADLFRDAIENSGAEAVIPPKKNRKTPITYDAYLYRDRNLVERFFNRIK